MASGAAIAMIGIRHVPPAARAKCYISLGSGRKGIYVEHSDRLDRLTQSVSAVGAPTSVPLRNPLIRVLSGLTFYLLPPVAMILFAWKAAVFPTWGAGLLCVATGVIASHVMLPFNKFAWRSKALLSVVVAIICHRDATA
jgi:hypothetical protein